MKAEIRTLNGTARRPEHNEPFLRWAGGKRWLSRRWHELFPSLAFKRYHEPFLGSGSIFLQTAPGCNAYLSDLNVDLIETYRAVKLEPERVIKALGRFRNTESFYYKVRDSRPRSSSGCAARFIYLNQTSFNGIHRVNLQGVYNVPFGFRSTPFINEEAIRTASKALRNAHLKCGDFFAALGRIDRGDFVFLDPPYTVSHNKNGFIKYNEKLFSLVDQHRLRDFVGRLEERGAQYVLTNANHPLTRELFDTGRNVSIELCRSNLVGGLHAKRGRTTELLFTNISGFNRE